MSTIKIQVSGYKPLAQLRYQEDGLYPGWYARFRLKGKLRKVALSTWDRDDSVGAHAAAAKLLRCSPDRIRVDSQQDPQADPSVRECVA